MKVYLTQDLPKALKNPLMDMAFVSNVVHASELLMQRNTFEENYYKAVKLKFNFIFTKNKAATSFFDSKAGFQTKLVLFEDANLSIAEMSILIYYNRANIFRAGRYSFTPISIGFKKRALFH